MNGLLTTVSAAVRTVAVAGPEPVDDAEAEPELERAELLVGSADAEHEDREHRRQQDHGVAEMAHESVDPALAERRDGAEHERDEGDRDGRRQGDDQVGRAAKASIEKTSRPIELVPSQWAADGADG